ncbi:hypothetical protein LCGC14_1126610 [marine sediment metagenome]|uniref:Phage minor structural protein GP20 n=1 Tax=marine sediment metagenome TaxID=412755 RepID=A0A0F9M2D8_9ZZZZ
MDLTFQELKDAVRGLPKNDQEEIAKATGFGKDDSKQIALTDQNKLLTEQVEVLKETIKTLTATITASETKELTDRKETVISLAITEGRILPADKEKWEKRFDSQPDFTADILAEQPKVVDLTDRGTGDKGKEAVKELTADEKKMAKMLELSEDEFRANGKPTPKKEGE